MLWMLEERNAKYTKYSEAIPSKEIKTVLQEEIIGNIKQDGFLMNN